MLLAVLDGAALPATELAYRGGASPQAASMHLRKLVEGRLLSVAPSGRQRRYRLASREVAHAIEALLSVAPPVRIMALAQGLSMERLRAARTCYDHLAGRLGVAVADALIDRGALRMSAVSSSLLRKASGSSAGWASISAPSVSRVGRSHGRAQTGRSAGPILPEASVRRCSIASLPTHGLSDHP
jgi:hypothetical protein